MEGILGEEGKKVILLGNEAIARGALEAGVAVAATYPGTPASEIGDTFARVAKEVGIYFEYSTNEKVATEVAAGAAFCGLRSIVSFKQYGLNVASDSIPPLAYLGVKGGMVIVVADDPECWSSGQSEQDSRYFPRIAHMPMLEPSDVQEAKDMVKFAFELSEKFGLPVFLRTTTRVSHMRGIVKLGKIVRGKTIGKFERDIKFRNFPPYIIRTHQQLHEKLNQLKTFSERSKLNFVVNKNTKSKLGAIASGVAFNYLMEAMEELNVKIPVLKIGFSYPLPEKTISKFIKGLKEVLILEELEPMIEGEVKRIAKFTNPKILIHGKDMLPAYGEFKPEMVMEALSKLTGKKVPKELGPRFEVGAVAKRLPALCPGCPHRATFWSVKKAVGEDKIFGGDIGCYILGILPPINMADFVISMGASIGISQGIEKASKEKPIAFIGDSTFFHAGIPGLINAVYNKSNLLVVVLDNRTTAMTGHQPHPGSGVTGVGEETKALAIEEIARACGVENVRVVNSFNLGKLIEAVKELYSLPGVGVIVSRGECRLLAVRKMARKGIRIPKFEVIDLERVKEKTRELEMFGCPAIRMDGEKIYIEEDLCWGCGVCVQICPGGIRGKP